jgi:hypothetical protein
MTRTLTLQTDGGNLHCRMHEQAPGDTAVLWVFGAGGGFNGPAGGIYPRLSLRLAADGVAGLELAYRHPARLDPCVQDALVGIEWLKRIGRPRVILVGHSFGGAVVISAAAASPDVVGVAALSSQLYGAEAIAHIAPRPVVFLHGEADEILPDRCSRELYRLARDPKQLHLYPGCRHGLDECREALDRDLLAWLTRVARGWSAHEGSGTRS